MATPSDIEQPPKPYLMTISQRPDFNHTFVNGKAYPPGAHSVEFTEAQAKAALRKEGVRLRPIDGANGEFHAEGLVQLSPDQAVLLSGFNALCAEIAKLGLPPLSAADYVGFANERLLAAAQEKLHPATSEPEVKATKGNQKSQEPEPEVKALKGNQKAQEPEVSEPQPPPQAAPTSAPAATSAGEQAPAPATADGKKKK